MENKFVQCMVHASFLLRPFKFWSPYVAPFYSDCTINIDLRWTTTCFMTNMFLGRWIMWRGEVLSWLDVRYITLSSSKLAVICPGNAEMHFTTTLRAQHECANIACLLIEVLGYLTAGFKNFQFRFLCSCDDIMILGGQQSPAEFSAVLFVASGHALPFWKALFTR